MVFPRMCGHAYSCGIWRSRDCCVCFVSSVSVIFPNLNCQFWCMWAGLGYRMLFISVTFQCSNKSVHYKRMLLRPNMCSSHTEWNEKHCAPKTNHNIQLAFGNKFFTVCTLTSLILCEYFQKSSVFFLNHSQKQISATKMYIRVLLKTLLYIYT